MASKLAAKRFDILNRTADTIVRQVRNVLMRQEYGNPEEYQFPHYTASKVNLLNSAIKSGRRNLTREVDELCGLTGSDAKYLAEAVKRELEDWSII